MAALFPPIVYKVPFSPASLPAFVICFLDDFQSDWGEIELQCCFDLHFFSD
jgi:hypothetical protein